MTLAVGVAALGGLGAMLRYLLDNLITRRWGTNLPWGTMTINVVGSFGAGLVVGAFLHGNLGAHDDSLLAVGFLGGFTTASTFAVEIARLASGGRLSNAARSSIGTAGIALGGGLMGHWLLSL